MLEPLVKYSLEHKAECDNLAPTRKHCFSRSELFPPSSSQIIFLRLEYHLHRKLHENKMSLKSEITRECTVSFVCVCKYMYFVEIPWCLYIWFQLFCSLSIKYRCCYWTRFGLFRSFFRLCSVFIDPFSFWLAFFDCRVLIAGRFAKLDFMVYYCEKLRVDWKLNYYHLGLSEQVDEQNRNDADTQNSHCSPEQIVHIPNIPVDCSQHSNHMVLSFLLASVTSWRSLEILAPSAYCKHLHLEGKQQRNGLLPKVAEIPCQSFVKFV